MNFKKVIHKAFWLILLFLLLFFDNNLQDPKILPQLLGLSILLLLYYSFIKEIKIPKTPTFIYIGFVIFSLLALNKSYVISDALITFEKSIIFYLLFTLFYNTANSSQKEISWFISTFIIIINLTGIAQLIHLGIETDITHETTYRVVGYFGHRNLFAEILLLCIPLSAYLLLTSNKKIIHLININLSVLLIIIYSSRAVWAGLILVVILVTALIFINKIKPTRKVILSLFTSFVFLITSVYIFKISTNDYLSHIVNYNDNISEEIDYTIKNEARRMDKFSSVGERFTLWNKSYALIKSSPLIGVGLDNWHIDMLQIDSKGPRSEEGQLFPQRPHNDFLWIISEIGFIGGLCYLSFFCLILFKTSLSIAKFEKTKDKLQIIMLVAVLVGYLSISFFAFPKERLTHTVLVTITLGLLLSKVQIFDTYTFPKLSKLFFIPLLVGLIAFTSLKYHEELKWSAVIGQNRQSSKPIKLAQKPISNLFLMDKASTPMYYYKGLEQFNQQNFEQAIDLFGLALQYNPYHMHALNNIATSLVQLERYEEAIPYYQKALTVNSKLEEAKLNLVSVFYNIHQDDQAISYLSSCEETESDRFTNSLRIVTLRIIRNQIALNTTIETQNKLTFLINHQEVIYDLFQLSKIKHTTFKKEVNVWLSIY